jgi:hypothetical protein
MKLSALSAGRPLHTEDSWYSFLLESDSIPGKVRLEVLGQLNCSVLILYIYSYKKQYRIDYLYGDDDRHYSRNIG